MQFRITSQLANVFLHYSYVTGSNVIKRKGVKMKKSESDDCFVAGTAEELLDALKLKADYILITKYYKREFLDKTELPLPEMGFFSGTRMAASAGGSPVFLFLNWLEKNDKQQRKIDSKVQKYMLKEHGEDLLLYLRQLTY